MDKKLSKANEIWLSPMARSKPQVLPVNTEPGAQPCPLSRNSDMGVQRPAWLSVESPHAHPGETSTLLPLRLSVGPSLGRCVKDETVVDSAGRNPSSVPRACTRPHVVALGFSAPALAPGDPVMGKARHSPSGN